MFAPYTYPVLIRGDYQEPGSNAAAVYRRFMILSDLAAQYTEFVSDVRWDGPNLEIDITPAGFQAAADFFDGRSHDKTHARDNNQHGFWIESAEGEPAKRRIREFLKWAKQSNDLITIKHDRASGYHFGLTAKGLNLFYDYLMERKAAFEAGEEESCEACTI